MSAPVAPEPAPAPAAPPAEAGFRGRFRSDAAARGAYAEAAGIGHVVPRAVAVPAGAADAEALVRWAARAGTPLVPRGSGSSMAGGAIGDGVILDVSRLRALGPVDVAARRVLAQPGVTGAAVDARARQSGLRFPVDPSSWQFCSVGGMASANAAGAHSLRHGAMRPWVTALDCVFADGTRAVVRRGAPPPDLPAVRRFLAEAAPAVDAAAARGVPLRRAVRKDSSGYALGEWQRSRELVDLLVGSEGTLAVFVGVELALAPLPGATASVLGVFPTLDAAVRAAVAAREAGAVACELLDRTFLEVAARGTDVPGGGRRTGWRAPDGAAAALLADAEGASAGATVEAARVLRRAFDGAGAREVTLALDPGAERALWALRHAASPILARLDPALKSMQFIEDGAVPPARLADYVRGVRAALARQGVRGVIFGHAGDGHVHVNPLVDVRDPAWRARVEGLLEDVTALAASLGGTLAGEHGDGRLRTPLMARTWTPEALALFAATKRAFDPAGILNPGVKVPADGQRAIDAIKYDPTLPALPAAARRALDHVAATRDYSADRLALVDAAP
ncbi:FAD-binding oxidoreductase [Roseisolibacter sp. H3M3-2]|uniref:FAD-binding oxidoreductase n=1 Tax=Roseisolibacter sp. H3M3-2 TaxID=3031323 RepID=UPI0023DC9149|nr:FAD-binding oxidoreductase [Roseisolibacter sp. H3M3-2]MDF1501652.1 FAD-binding oxidoreductase [Roseisolibacter sp. H3M3-2]